MASQSHQQMIPNRTMTGLDPTKPAAKISPPTVSPRTMTKAMTMTIRTSSSFFASLCTVCLLLLPSIRCGWSTEALVPARSITRSPHQSRLPPPVRRRRRTTATTAATTRSTTPTRTTPFFSVINTNTNAVTNANTNAGINPPGVHVHSDTNTALSMVYDHDLRDPDMIEMVTGGVRYENVPLPDSMLDTTLFVGNLCEFARDEDLSEQFRSVTKLRSLPACVARRPNNQSLKYGFVAFPTVEEKEAAIIRFHGVEFMGRRLKVEEILDHPSKGRVHVPEKLVTYVLGTAKKIPRGKHDRSLRKISNPSKSKQKRYNGNGGGSSSYGSSSSIGGSNHSNSNSNSNNGKTQGGRKGDRKQKRANVKKRRRRERDQDFFF